MTTSVFVRKQNIRSGTKVKTGCATCRIRKVKCDETKPFCKKCVNTGRTCDGYESPFRLCTSQPINKAQVISIKSDIGLGPVQPVVIEITSDEIDLLNRYFSIKTILDVKLDCDEEARQVLQASLTDSSVRHAVSSLRALREDLETYGNNSVFIVQPTPSYSYGLQQYSMALRGLAANLSSPGANALRSALLCCQMFISIEQLQGNYAGMAQHIIQGLKIMHQHRIRLDLTATNPLMPVFRGQIPLLDVFIIKLFSAPCKFAEPPSSNDVSGTTSPVTVISSLQMPVKSHHLRMIAPDMRTELTRIATSTLNFLDKVSRVESVAHAIRLLSDRAALLDSLESWLIELEIIQMEIGSSGPESIHMSFLRYFHLVLKVILLGALESSAHLDVELQIEHGRIQDVANSLGDRLRNYKICGGASSSRGVQSEVR